MPISLIRFSMLLKAMWNALLGRVSEPENNCTEPPMHPTGVPLKPLPTPGQGEMILPPPPPNDEQI